MARRRIFRNSPNTSTRRCRAWLKPLAKPASLLIADELFEAYRQIHALGAQDSQGRDAAGALEACAERLEAIAARLADA